MKLEERVRELEAEVSRLKTQLLDLALRQPTVIYTQPYNPPGNPIVPYVPYMPSYPIITCGDIPSPGGLITGVSGTLSGAQSGASYSQPQLRNTQENQNIGMIQ